MQTGLGQPPNLCAANTRRSVGSLRGIWRECDGEKGSKKLATLCELLLSACVDICITGTYINISVGRKGGGGTTV